MKQISSQLSIISPVYEAESLLDELVSRIVAQVSPLTSRFEIILIDDGSQDGTWKKVEDICLRDKRVKGIRLSRNFGQHSAIAAGIEAACGEWVVVMDCDLQDRPEEIPALYRKALEGYDIVLARRSERKDRLNTRISSKLFYSLLSWLSGIKYDSSIANFGIYHHKVILPMLQVQSSIPFFPAMVNWVGFSQTSILVEHAERLKGKSSYNFAKKIKLAIHVTLSHKNNLLRCMIGCGMAISLLILFCSGVLSFYDCKGLFALLSSLSGLMIFILGIIALYVGKMADTAQGKPSFLIRKKIND